MNSDMIAFDVEAGVCTLTLRNVARRNALNAGMRKLLLDYLGVIEARDDIRSVLLTGDGPVFCSGQDLEEDVMQVGDDAVLGVGRVLHEQYHPIYRAMYRLTKPTPSAQSMALPLVAGQPWPWLATLLWRGISCTICISIC